MTNHHDRSRIPASPEAAQILWRAAQSDTAAMAVGLHEGTATRDDIDATLARLRTLDIDPARHRDTVDVPADAGTAGAVIETILRRIPDGWDRSLRVDAGWYPLVIATDARLTRLDPDYVVHQIKEKYGTLRYVCAPRSEDPPPELADAMDAITDDAQRASARTCERCGQPGTLHQSPRHWVKTRCAMCACMLGYTPAYRQR
jgi:hypothetical protein